MKAVLGFVLLFSLMQGPAYGKYNWSKANWEKVSVKEKITTYRKSFKDSDVKGVAGSAMINASPSKIVWVLMDHDHKDQWVDKFKDARTLETPSLLRSVQYAAFDMPFPVSDRDFVYQYDFTYDKKKNMIEVNVKNAIHKGAPEKDTVGVRGEIVMGKYRLYPRDGGKKTYVEVEYLADPKGLLPSWVVNIVQKSWPYKTLKGLRKQVKKDFVGDHEIITRGLNMAKL